jgi:ATP-dependent DNA ligase
MLKPLALGAIAWEQVQDLRPALALAQALPVREAILEGEDCTGWEPMADPSSIHLLRRRGEPRFYAFDLLLIDGQDLR